MKKTAFAAMAVVLSLVCCLLVLEFGIRAATGSLSEWRNYATDPANMIKTNVAVDFDAELGWVLKHSKTTGEWRNRLHTPSPNADTDRPILAVGDSFTYGSEVAADDSWPALLERKTGIKVINGGVGGYGLDQSALLAERLIPQIKPRLVLFSFIHSDITRTRMYVFSGASKPFFTAENGQLKAHNLPLKPYVPSMREFGLRPFLGYSRLADWTAERLGLLGRWRASFPFLYEKADEVATSCAFMHRLSRVGVPVYVVVQHGWNDFIPEAAGILPELRAVSACARDAGLPIIDSYELLRARLPSKDGDPGFEKYYVNGKGHMTPAGNDLVAQQIADFLNAEKVRSASQ